jgi:hypothetical protein
LVIFCLLVRPDSVGKYTAGILSDNGILSGASAPKPHFPADQEEKARIVKEQARPAAALLKKALHIMSVKQSFQAKSKTACRTSTAVIRRPHQFFRAVPAPSLHQPRV